VTALLAASVTGHVETIATLVARGASLDYETQLQAGTALIVSSAAGKLPSIGALVRHGANVNYETRSGLTALVVAAAKGQSKVRAPACPPATENSKQLRNPAPCSPHQANWIPASPAAESWLHATKQ